MLTTSASVEGSSLVSGFLDETFRVRLVLVLVVLDARDLAGGVFCEAVFVLCLLVVRFADVEDLVCFFAGVFFVGTLRVFELTVLDEARVVFVFVLV